MASQDSFYTGSGAGTGGNVPGIPTINTPVSPGAYGFSVPPRPPPKPTGHTHSRIHSSDPSRTGTPIGGQAIQDPTSNHVQHRAPPPIPAQTGIPNPINSPFSGSQPGFGVNPTTAQASNYPQPQTPQQSGTGGPGNLTQNPQPPQYMGQNPAQATAAQTIPPPAFEHHWLPTQPDLSSKPITELTPLLTNPDLLQSLATTHPSFTSSQIPAQQAIQLNRTLATQVLQLENQVKQLREQTAQLLLSQTSLQTQWRRKQSEMDDALSPWGPRAMYQRLIQGIGEQEAYLRAVQESFLEGEGIGGGDDSYYGGHGGKASEKEVSEWVKRIREGATTLEKRREMRGRWDDGRVGGWR